MKVQSSVSNALLKKRLLRGTLTASLGVLLLLFTGLFVPKSLLTLIGLPSLIVSSLLIGSGLIPYRKLAHLQMRPHELQLIETHLLFIKGGNPLFKIATSAIEKMEYGERDSLYGLKIFLNKQSHEKVTPLASNFDLKSAQAHAKTYFDCDLFLPYFTLRTIKELNHRIL